MPRRVINTHEEVSLIYVGPCHQVGDTIIHVPNERVVFAGDVLFRQCTPVGWTGTYENWFTCLDLLLRCRFPARSFVVPVRR
jgi:glyoxylase-like metal-dependent hydrolase (beta-lactamase superfamily II)